MKGKFVKGEIIKLAINTFELEINNLNKETATEGMSKENINQNIKWMNEYREAKEYLQHIEIPERFKKLIGQELNLVGLQNEIIALKGEISEFRTSTDILHRRSIIVSTGPGRNHIRIAFKIIEVAGKEEVIEATIIKITGVEEY